MRLTFVLIALSGSAISQLIPMDRTISSDSPALAVEFLEDGNTVAALSGDGKLRVWDARSGALRQTHGTEPITSPHILLPGRDQFATVAKDGKVEVRNATNGSLLLQLPAVKPRATRLAVSNDGSRVATAHMFDRQTGVNTIQVRDADGKMLFSAPSGLGGISVLRFSPDGSTLVAGSYDADLRVWSIRNGELVQLIDSLPVSMFALSFSPDGKRLAAAGVDRTVYIWDTSNWSLVTKLTGQPEMISALAFSPDGNRLVTGGFSELTVNHPVQLIVWDVANARQLRTMPAPRRVAAVAFSPDGKHLASAYGDKSVNIWQLPD